MKKVLLGIFSLLLISVSVFAQDDPVKAGKKAAKALSAFNLDPTNNGDKLTEAKEMINVALKSDEVAATAKAWQTKGEIYSTSVSQDLGKRVAAEQLGQDIPPMTDMDGAILANEAFVMALKKAVKKYETKEALEGLRANIGNLSNIGIINYKAGEMEAASANFAAVMDAHKVLQEAGSESPLDNKDDYNNALYLAALGASGSGDMETAAKYYDELAANDYNDAAVYDGIYKANIDSNPEKALAALEKGRQLFPDNTSLLFTEINYYLKENKLDVLTGKLQNAIDKEPDNVSLYSTLGNVYDNLFQRENKAGNTEKEKEYFDLALKNYNTAIEKDPNYTDATYSIGALYYNKAAAMTQSLDKLADDYSKAGIAKYKAKQQEIFGFFDQALPYFKKVEMTDPNDVNTLIALKEIFAKKDDLVTSNEIKKRLQTVQSGGKNETSFFKK